MACGPSSWGYPNFDPLWNAGASSRLLCNVKNHHAGAKDRHLTESGGSDELRPVATQLDRATTQPPAHEGAPHRAIRTASPDNGPTQPSPAWSGALETGPARGTRNWSPDKESGTIEGVEDDFEPELRNLELDESEEELPTEPLPAMAGADNENGRGSVYDVEEPSLPSNTFPAGVPSKHPGVSSPGARLPGAPEDDQETDSGAKDRHLTESGGSDELRPVATQLDRATTQPPAHEGAPHRAIRTASPDNGPTQPSPAWSGALETGPARGTRNWSPDKESGTIEGVEDDFEPELRNLELDESEEELPTEPLPAMAGADNENGRGSVYDVEEPSLPSNTFPAGVPSKHPGVSSPGARLPGAPEDDQETDSAGFLLALTFLFFAGDDRAVVDLLRLDLRLLLFPAVAFLALDLLVVALAPLVLERDDRRLLVRLVVLRFAGVVEALFLLRLRAREGSAMEAPSLTPLVDAESIRKNLARPASTFSLSQVWA
ncbi:uncharacterized protein ISCGN_000688 [Ixodes scapularis]